MEPLCTIIIVYSLDLTSKFKIWDSTFSPKITMWYEILPHMTILVTGLVFTPIFGFYAYKFMQHGNPYRRDIRKDPFDKGLLHRDIYLFKKPYLIRGLDNIPDEENAAGTSSEKKKDPCKC